MTPFKDAITTALENYSKNHKPIAELVDDAMKNGIEHMENKAGYGIKLLTQNVNRAKVVYYLKKAATTDYSNDDKLHQVLCGNLLNIILSTFDWSHELYSSLITIFMLIGRHEISIEITDKKSQFTRELQMRMLLLYKLEQAKIRINYVNLIPVFAAAATSGSIMAGVAAVFAIHEGLLTSIKSYLEAYLNRPVLRQINVEWKKDYFEETAALALSDLYITNDRKDLLKRCGSEMISSMAADSATRVFFIGLQKSLKNH